MRAFTNANPRDLPHALTLIREAQSNDRTASIAGGGSDLLGMIKERIENPDVLVNLKSIKGLDQIAVDKSGLKIGGLTTLNSIAHHQLIRRDYTVLAEAAETVATPQIRNVGTLAGNVAQRPWCWYYRNGFPCFKAGGKQCFSINGENQFHAIFGGGPSFIVHPSDTAPALVALDAKFHIAGPKDEILASIEIPSPRPATRSAYHKVMDREAWTHALVSAAIVLEMDRDICRQARIVLGGVAPIPWRVPEAEKILTGQRITPDLAAKAAEQAIAGAVPLAKNAYKLPLTKNVVRRTISDLAQRV
jgi:xanthine dehydrogenase YagS FAD-binding subunit